MSVVHLQTGKYGQGRRGGKAKFARPVEGLDWCTDHGKITMHIARGGAWACYPCYYGVKGRW